MEARVIGLYRIKDSHPRSGEVVELVGRSVGVGYIRGIGKKQQESIALVHLEECAAKDEASEDVPAYARIILDAYGRVLMAPPGPGITKREVDANRNGFETLSSLWKWV